MIKINKNTNQWISGTIMGLYVGVGRWFGNCMAPAVVVEYNGLRRNKGAVVVVTLRTSNHTETTIYMRPLRVWWNSGHLANRFGKFIDTDFGGYYAWGHHTDM